MLANSPASLAGEETRWRGHRSCGCCVDDDQQAPVDLDYSPTRALQHAIELYQLLLSDAQMVLKSGFTVTE